MGLGGCLRLPIHRDTVDNEVNEQPSHHPDRDSQAEKVGTDGGDDHCHGDGRPHDQQGEEERAPPVVGQDAQPAQAKIEHAAKEPQIGDETQKAGDDQRVQSLVVRAVGRGSAGFVVAQERRVKGVVGHVHRLWPVANQKAHRVERVGVPIRIRGGGRELDRIVRQDHPQPPLPDESTHHAGAAFRL